MASDKLPDASVPAHWTLTLRDYFAGQALAGYAARMAADTEQFPSYADLARWAYAQADAMLAARAKAAPK